MTLDLVNGVLMKQKNFIVLSLSMALSLILNAIVVFAQDDFFNDWMRFIFVDLSNLAESGDQIFVIYFKIFLFFLVFAVLFWASEKVIHDKKNISVTVAFIIALMSVILLPAEYVLMIFSTYSIIIGYIFIVLPVIVGIVLANKLADEMEGHDHIKRIIKGIIFIVIAILTFSLSTTLISQGESVYYEVAKWAKIGGVVTLFVGIYYIISMGKKDKDEQTK